jgi:hypothetical protein
MLMDQPMHLTHVTTMTADGIASAMVDFTDGAIWKGICVWLLESSAKSPG